mmetsp:Transcript_26805/g.53497  ORF Transcript_26805/g.53497 Transcript_26805/m.53497 type:complete len:261 (-) Transcript_26805:273-1055(-)
MRVSVISKVVLILSLMVAFPAASADDEVVDTPPGTVTTEVPIASADDEVVESMECDANGDCKVFPSNDDAPPDSLDEDLAASHAADGGVEENLGIETEMSPKVDIIEMNNPAEVGEDDKVDDFIEYADLDILPPEDEVIEDCEDHEENCELWAKNGECRKNRSFMFQNCPFTCNVCIPDFMRSDPDAGKEQEVIGNHDEYLKMYNIMRKMYFYRKTLDESVAAKCINDHERCVYWASADECINNHDWMSTGCGLACSECP